VASVAGEAAIKYDARGLVEVDETVPHVATIDGDRAEFDAHDLTTRKINLELRRLVYDEGIKEVTIRNPAPSTRWAPGSSPAADHLRRQPGLLRLRDHRRA
jgi:hypothetical protein